MIVFVINKYGKALMPCSTRKARILLKQKKAKIYSYQPFAIKLVYGSYGYRQKVSIGVDLGAKHIGVAIQSENKVLAKGEITLRDDIKSNLETRKIYRRSRRNRKTRYRKARFLNRVSTKKKGWLPPSIQSRIQNTFSWIDKFVYILPSPKLIIEVGKFDVQKMLNPNINGEQYQQAETYGYYNVRYYVFARDNYTCQVCKKKNKILRTHHIIYKSKGGTDRADNLITVCTDCHTNENHKKDNVLWKWCEQNKKVSGYKETVFMNIIRQKIFIKYPNAEITYGSITTPKRKKLELEKTHYNDAIAISKIEKIKENTEDIFKIVQFRKKKRSLHESTPRKGRKEKNTTAKRNRKNTKQINNWCINDKVNIFGKIGFITGFTGKTGCYVKDIEGNYILQERKSYKNINLSQLKLLKRNNNWQYGIVKDLVLVSP